MREVECKMQVASDQVEILACRIQDVLSEIEPREVHKEDVYFSKDGVTADFRVRISDDSVLVTRKVKELRTDGVEINEEIEFSVLRESVGQLNQFFASLKFLPSIQKYKRGKLWRRDTLTVELVNVKFLGWFLEIEFLLPNSATVQQIDESVKLLSSLRRQLGVDTLPVESRYYIDMLQEVKNR
jgi:adenylate cyclase class 2